MDIQITPELRQKLNNALGEIVNSKTRASAETELQREIIKDLVEATGIEAKQLRKLATARFKGESSKAVEESETFTFLAENLL